MASYKVAQDVEAEDKLLGPFSFRQFIYLVIAALAGVVAYGLSRIFMPLFIIPAPIILFFVILALPLRKDQPMEIYLAAIVSYYLKPRKRLWKPDGIQSLIEITVPATKDTPRTKDLSEFEAERRLAYLATLADTQGWSIRNATAPAETSSMAADVYHEAQATEDVFDESGDIARSFEDRILKADAARRQAMVDGMQRAASGVNPAPVVAPATQPAPTPAPRPATDDTADVQVNYNPYPSSMRQRVISPTPTDPTPPQAPAAIITPETAATTSSPPTQPTTDDTAGQDAASSTSDNTVSPDIINLANNTDLSIDTIAREAHRINEKKSRNDPGEVVISLR